MLKHTIISIGGGNYNIYLTVRFGLVHFVVIRMYSRLKIRVFGFKCVINKFALPNLSLIKIFNFFEKLVSNVGIKAFWYMYTKYFDLIKLIEVLYIETI